MNGLPRDWLPTLVGFLNREPVVVRIVVAEVRGSTPREPGAFMLVGRDGVEGSIGGGRLEWEAIASARELLDDTGAAARVNKVVLGPDVGQCCGGVVSVWLERFTRESLGLLRMATDAGARGCAVLSSTIRGASIDHQVLRPAVAGMGVGAGALVGTDVRVGADVRAGAVVGASMRAGQGAADSAADDVGLGVGVSSLAETVDRLLRAPRQRALPVLTCNSAGDLTFIERLDDELPAVWLFGAGHVGQALARILVELPLRLTWIDSRAELLPTTLGDGVRILNDPDSVATVSEAPVGAYFIVMSHSHPLDFALCHALLERNDFAWLGLIGSMSKAARFRSRLARAGLGADVIRKLVCPIGVDGIESKWPAAIAVAVAAQLMQQISAVGVGQPELRIERHESPPPRPPRLESQQVNPGQPEPGSAESARVGRMRVESGRAELARVGPVRIESAQSDAPCAPENCATCGSPAPSGTVTS
jgi:xanthine dehydrogenase accessory factor